MRYIRLCIFRQLCFFAASLMYTMQCNIHVCADPSGRMGSSGAVTELQCSNCIISLNQFNLLNVVRAVLRVIDFLPAIR